MSSTVYNALKDLGVGDIAIILVFVSLFIDITPAIKFNPVRWVISKFGEAFNHNVNKSIDSFKTEVYDKIDELKTQIDDRMDTLEEQVSTLTNEQKKIMQAQMEEAKVIDLAEISRLENNILDFSYQLSKQSKFTLDEYRKVMDQYSEYENIVAKYPDVSHNKVKTEYDTIIDHFNRHKECGDYMF